MPIQMDVKLVGLRDTERALKQIAPEVTKEMNRRIRGALRPVVQRAKAEVPEVALSGWDDTGTGEWSTRLGWDPAAVRKGIKIRKGGSRDSATGARTAWRITNQSPAGAVFELAGRRNGGSEFAQALRTAGHGSASRLIWHAWDQAGGAAAVEDEIVAAVDDAQAQLQRHLDGAAA